MRDAGRLAAFFYAVLLFGFLNSDFILLNVLPTTGNDWRFRRRKCLFLNNLLYLWPAERGIAFAAPPDSGVSVFLLRADRWVHGLARWRTS